MSFATIPGAAPLRGVVVGAGKLGPYWARELIESPDTELVGWTDLDGDRVAAEAATLGVPEVATGDPLEAVLHAVRPDFVVNVTAPGAHYAVTIAALEHGAAVLSEKPLAATLAEALEMVASAERTGRLFMVSQNRRYLPELIAFRDTVAQLGTLSELTCDFYIAHREDAAEFLFGFDQPLLLDMAIHLFDGARAITGAAPESVYCDAYNPPWSWYAGAAAASAIFRMSGGLRFTFTGDWAADGFRTSWTGSWRAVGEHGSATWEGDGAAPRAEAAPGAQVRAVAPAAPSVVDDTRFMGLADALADFVRALRTGTPPAGECHDNILSLAMCHAAVESTVRGARVDVRTG